MALDLAGALGTGVAYLIFFRVIERWGATRTTLVTYVIPVVAIVLGFLFLDERLRPLELRGCCAHHRRRRAGQRQRRARSRSSGKPEAEAKAQAKAQAD